MWATLTVMTALTLPPGQSSTVQLTKERVTFGMLGPTRNDREFLPGDVYFLHFDIEGLTLQEGLVRYTMQMELFDGKGVSKFKTTNPEERTVFNVLGGARVPGFAHAILGLDAEPGEYTLKLNVTDLHTKAKSVGSLQRKFLVGKRDFGVVGVNLTYDGRFPAPPLGMVGQAVVLGFGVVGFQRDAKTKQPQVALELRVLDSDGRPTTNQAVKDEVKKLEEKLSVLGGAFDIALTRPGRFTVELKATDALTKKSSTITLPIVVAEAPQ